MKLEVRLTWGGGILADGEPDTHPEPLYDLFDADTGECLREDPFTSFRTLEAYIAARYPGVERWVPPPPPANEAAKLERMLRMLESEAGRPALDQRVVHNFLVGHLYQYGYPPATVARIRAELGLGEAPGAARRIAT